MGVFSFLRGVGNRLVSRGGGGRDGSDETPDAEALKQELDKHGLGTENMTVDVDKDGKVRLSGDIKDQAALEKAIVAVGNSMGVSEVDSNNVKVAGADQKDPIFYTVKSGDNLWKIAEAMYGKGHGDKNPLIFEANKPMLTSPDKIYPGQVLRIPPLS